MVMSLDDLLSKETSEHYMEFTLKTSGKNLSKELPTLFFFKFVNFLSKQQCFFLSKQQCFLRGTVTSSLLQEPKLTHRDVQISEDSLCPVIRN